MSYPPITPNFQVLYKGCTAYLVFVDEEPECPGLARHSILAPLEYRGMEQAARELLAVQNSICYRISKWFRALRNEHIWRMHWWRNQ